MSDNLQRVNESVLEIRPKKPTKARYGILMLLFIGTAINYMDRTNISVAAPEIQKYFHLNPTMLGLIFSAFAWSYAIGQIPGGWVLDRFGPKRTYGTALSLWSVFTFLQGVAHGFGFLFVMRLGMGLTESPAFPTNNKVVTSWFPQKERAFATGVYTAGEFVGLAFLTPFLFWLLSSFGWRSIFFVTGVIGLLYAFVWVKRYCDPKESKTINQAELEYIQEGGGLTENTRQGNKINWHQARELFKHRQFWGLYIGQFGVTSTLYFFLTWFPTYLITEKHMTILKAGFFASVPYIAAFIGVLCGGFWSDWMLKRGKKVGIARKTPIVLGLLFSCCIILANYTSSVGLIILIMSIAFFGQGMSGISWSLVSEIAPAKLVGLAGGVFNFAGNLSGIVTPLLIGFIVSATNSFSGALLVVGGFALMGALSYIFLLGKVKRIEIDS
ncbi:MFS transporter [Priestia megaterium]|uniref:MFS transporter n=1 Tax=Priestia megaterium TaxID=1404 RepID=UPI001C8DA5D7|nr:MFS transporter [Priestia megaterium]MBY0199508.1 MFS transporter [Priestia megaterium]